jgi:DNA-binding CsgD family transcriptional regulator
VSGPTRRELEVLVAYVEAGTTRAAAHDLGISERGVKSSLTRLRDKLGAKSSAQAFAICLHSGRLSPDGRVLSDVAVRS